MPSARTWPDIGARWQPSPESVAGSCFQNPWRRIHFERGCECPFQPRIFDLPKKPAENGVGRFVPAQQGTAQVGAGPSKEAEMCRPIVLLAAAVDLVGNRHHMQSIRIVARHGKSQQRQLPCAQHPVVPFG
jgi:hypothetical protein